MVGIETYSEAPKATYANRDAKFFAEYARYAFGASRNNIKLLIDKDATSVKMYGALEKWLPAKIQSDQTDVIVFFAGHGLASVDGKTITTVKDLCTHLSSAERKNKKVNLLTRHINCDYRAQTRYSSHELTVKNVKLVGLHAPKDCN